MKPLISYFFILVWLSDYIENYNLDCKDTFIMGGVVMIYSIKAILKNNNILNKMKNNIRTLAKNLLMSIVILPSITCISIYKYNVLNYQNSRSLILGNYNTAISILLIIGLLLIPILIIYLPKKIINLLNM